MLLENKKKLIIIAGPTASGKSELAVELAKIINGAVISADSMQVYKGMDIGTAKITEKEKDGIPHYLIDEIDPSCDFNVWEFQKLAKKYIRMIYADGKIPILCGGTGFYIQAVLYDIDFSKEGPEKAYRKHLEDIAASEGGAVLFEKLKEIDPEAALSIHPHNVKRVIRALEYYEETGEKISVHNHMQKNRPSPYDFTYIVVNRDRALLYDRINRRVDKMFEDGLVQEVERLLAAGISPSATSMQGLGYKETAAFLSGDCSLKETADQIKKESRHYAKRQITWFKREQDAIWLDHADFSDSRQMAKKIAALAGF